ncbi:MAG: hypothetical protein QOE60_2048, partial [Thermoleophilaceae bacterium]|nr:hypothetical protein [Thermoleophilaceae bacterium]
AEIFHDFMTAWLSMRDLRRAAHKTNGSDATQAPVAPTQTIDPNAVPDAQQPTDTTPKDQGNGGNQQNQPDAAPQDQTPAEPPGQQTPAPVEPPPTPVQPPSGGTGGTGGGATPDATG